MTDMFRNIWRSPWLWSVFAALFVIVNGLAWLNRGGNRDLATMTSQKPAELPPMEKYIQRQTLGDLSRVSEFGATVRSVGEPKLFDDFDVTPEQLKVRLAKSRLCRITTNAHGEQTENVSFGIGEQAAAGGVPVFDLDNALQAIVSEDINRGLLEGFFVRNELAPPLEEIEAQTEDVPQGLQITLKGGGSTFSSVILGLSLTESAPVILEDTVMDLKRSSQWELGIRRFAERIAEFTTDEERKRFFPEDVLQANSANCCDSPLLKERLLDFLTSRAAIGTREPAIIQERRDYSNQLERVAFDAELDARLLDAFLAKRGLLPEEEEFLVATSYDEVFKGARVTIEVVNGEVKAAQQFFEAERSDVEPTISPRLEQAIAGAMRARKQFVGLKRLQTKARDLFTAEQLATYFDDGKAVKRDRVVSYLRVNAASEGLGEVLHEFEHEHGHAHGHDHDHGDGRSHSHDHPHPPKASSAPASPPQADEDR